MSTVLNHLFLPKWFHHNYDIDGLMQERRHSIPNALELRLSCTNLTICSYTQYIPRIMHIVRDLVGLVCYGHFTRTPHGYFIGIGQ